MEQKNGSAANVSKLTNCPIFFLAAFLLLLASCTKEKRNAVIESSSTVGEATLSSLQQDIITPGCAISGCHDNRTSPAGSLSLVDAETTYNNIVNKPSAQVTNAKLIVPGNPDSSYFIAKLKGTQSTLNGSGSQMPQGIASLTEAEIDRFEEWVTQGAPKN